MIGRRGIGQNLGRSVVRVGRSSRQDRARPPRGARRSAAAADTSARTASANRAPALIPTALAPETKLSSAPSDHTPRRARRARGGAVSRSERSSMRGLLRKPHEGASTRPDITNARAGPLATDIRTWHGWDRFGLLAFRIRPASAGPGGAPVGLRSWRDARQFWISRSAS